MQLFLLLPVQLGAEIWRKRAKLSRTKRWPSPRQRVLWINPTANISFPLTTPKTAGFEPMTPGMGIKCKIWNQFTLASLLWGGKLRGAASENSAVQLWIRSGGKNHSQTITNNQWQVGNRVWKKYYQTLWSEFAHEEHKKNAFRRAQNPRSCWALFILCPLATPFSDLLIIWTSEECVMAAIGIDFGNDTCLISVVREVWLVS